MAKLAELRAAQRKQPKPKSSTANTKRAHKKLDEPDKAQSFLSSFFAKALKNTGDMGGSQAKESGEV